MKKLLLFFIAVLVFVTTNLYAQDIKQAIIDTGRINNAMYRIVIPSNWNHNLVMYAHGYEMPVAKADPKTFHGPSVDMSVKPFLDRGFAVARSAYRNTGWALPQGVEDTEALRKYFFKKYGKPDSCFITGRSMGGGITLATIENFPKYYNGAMPMCPLASRPYLTAKRAFDIHAVLAAMFPDVIPPVSEVIKGTAPVLSKPAITAAIKKDSVLSSAIARRFEMKSEDLPVIFIFNDIFLRDIGRQAGGNPFDNTNTQYSGFPNDWELNQKIERLAANPGSEDFFDKYDRSGNTTIPTLLVHTIYDPIIPASLAVIPYDNMVHEKGKQSKLVAVYTKGQGHCSFTPQETGKAFDLLRKWVSTSKKPQAGILN